MASLAVKCNVCSEICSFVNSTSHDEIAFWTYYKTLLLCIHCARKWDQNAIYRKVHNTKDICSKRAYFFSSSHNDLVKYSQKDFVEKYSLYFCSAEEEERELAENNKNNIKSNHVCDCTNCAN